MIGLRPGDAVVVHSSLRATGLDANELIEALLGAVGPEGLVVMPAFTYDDPAGADAPSRAGALTEIFRLRPDAVRSGHPSHSVAAVGARARALCAGHEALPATAPGTPLDRVAAWEGLVLLIGVGHVANTTVHVGEFHADAPYLDIPFDPAWPSWGLDRFPGCSRAFGVVEEPLRRRVAVRDVRVGRAQAQLVEGAAVIDATMALLRVDPTTLLCTDPSCYRCSTARARLS